MKTWDTYKDHVKNTDENSAKLIEESENMAEIITEMIKKRSAMGLSQRNLASICGVPQSSVARIESMRIAPKIDTLMKLLAPLGLKLKVSAF